METTEPKALYARFLDYKPSKGEQRKRAIIEEAIHCIATIGVEKVSYETLGKRLKIGRAHVAYYFKSREEIIEAAIKFIIGTGQSFTVASVKEAPHGIAQLVAFINGTFDWLEKNPRHASAILLLYYYSSCHKSYRKIHDEIRDLGASRLTAIIESILPTKRKSLAPQMGKLVQSILTGHLLDHFTTHPKLSLEDLRAKTLQEVHLLIEAYTNLSKTKQS